MSTPVNNKELSEDISGLVHSPMKSDTPMSYKRRRTSVNFTPKKLSNRQSSLEGSDKDSPPMNVAEEMLVFSPSVDRHRRLQQQNTPKGELFFSYMISRSLNKKMIITLFHSFLVIGNYCGNVTSIC